jgi:hypothetical protein
MQALARVVRQTAPTYQALVDGVKASPVADPGEISWPVEGRAWLWVFAGQGWSSVAGTLALRLLSRH